MSNKITSIRGMNDVLPEQTPLWQWLEQRARAVLAANQEKKQEKNANT